MSVAIGTEDPGLGRLVVEVASRDAAPLGDEVVGSCWLVVRSDDGARVVGTVLPG
jgi:hypothetical protein